MKRRRAGSPSSTLSNVRKACSGCATALRRGRNGRDAVILFARTADGVFREPLHYGIMFRVLSRGGETLYERLIDCHRATRVNATMERLLFAGVVAAANSYLSRRSTAMDPRSRAAINAHFSNASQAGIPL